MSKKEVGLFSSKKGQGLSTSAIILIVLGVIILVILAFGFIAGWDKFKSIFGGSDNNIDSISLSCQTACTTRSSYDFCTSVRDVKVDSKEISASCYSLAVAPNLKQYGIEECSNINCGAVVECSDWKYTDKDNVVIDLGTKYPNLCISS